jgi:hypothetical protein
MERLRVLLGFAQELKARDITINVSQNGRLILRMGSEAKPGLLSFFGPIEVRDLRALLRFIGD